MLAGNLWKSNDRKARTKALECLQSMIYSRVKSSVATPVARKCPKWYDLTIKGIGRYSHGPFDDGLGWIASALLVPGWRVEWT